MPAWKNCGGSRQGWHVHEISFVNIVGFSSRTSTMLQQLVLPFGHAFREERAGLVRAIRMAGLRAAEETFVTYVHDVSRDGELHRTYNEIADRLNCSRRTAIRLVQRCVDAGVLFVSVDAYRSGGQRENVYSINWDGVRAVLFNEVGVTPQCQSVTGECQSVTPQCQSVTPYKEQEPFLDPLQEPPPPQKARAGGGGGSLDAWEQIRRRLRELGMADAPGAIREAQADAMTSQQAGAVIDEWEAARPAWDVGGLYWRFTRGTWPERAAVSREHEIAEQEKRRTRELLQGVSPRGRADPSEPSLVDQFRHLQQEIHG